MGSGVLNATANGTGLLVRDDDHYQTSFEDGQGSVGEWVRELGTHGNGLGVSICSSATAYEQTNVTTTSGTEALGQTVISVTDASVINVGDIVNFGETFEYETTARNTTSNEITIKLKDDPNGVGLQSQITSGTNIRRRWRFYDLFDGVQEHI